MKKFLILSLVLLGVVFGVNVQAQNTVYTMTGSGDTITNTGTDYVQIEVKNYYKTISLQTIITKVSGTVGGTVTIQGSVNGTNFVTIDTNVVKNNTVTFTPTNVTTNNVMFIIEDSPYRWYRISYTGTGTMAAKLYGYILPSR